MSNFEKSPPCDSVKIWSREIMTNEMFEYGFRIFKRFDRENQDGVVSSSGCLYTNYVYGAFAKQTAACCCSVMVWMEKTK